MHGHVRLISEAPLVSAPPCPAGWLAGAYVSSLPLDHAHRADFAGEVDQEDGGRTDHLEQI